MAGPLPDRGRGRLRGLESDPVTLRLVSLRPVTLRLASLRPVTLRLASLRHVTLRLASLHPKGSDLDGKERGRYISGDCIVESLQTGNKCVACWRSVVIPVEAELNNGQYVAYYPQVVAR